MQPTKIEPTNKQRQVIRALKSGKYRYVLTGGAISTAKSYGLALIIISMALQFPGTRYGVFRRNRVVLKRTTYQTFRKVARTMGLEDKNHYTINLSELMWEFYNGSQIWFTELDETKDPEFNKAKGLELTAAGIDEANEVIEEGFRIVGTRVGRENYHGEPQFVLLTCNPSDNWVKDLFYMPWSKDALKPPYLFIPSLPKDNPYNSPEYLAGLEANPPQFRKRYVEGNWDYVDDSNALFRNLVIDRAMRPVSPKRGMRFIGADIARAGADNTVFALIEDGMLVDLYLPDIDKDDDQAILVNVAEELIRYMQRHGVGYRYTTVDSNGLGEGVRDYLISKKFYVNGFKSGAKSAVLDVEGNPRYDMLRSERYWELARSMEAGTFTIWQGLPNLEELRRDLLAHNVEITDKQIKVESKELMKKRLGRSPDFSDAVMMAFSTPEPASAKDVYVGGSINTWMAPGDDDDDY